MEKNSFDQSLKPITRRKLLTRGLSLSLSVCLSLSVSALFASFSPCLHPLSLSFSLSLLTSIPTLSRHLLCIHFVCLNLSFCLSLPFTHLLTSSHDLIHHFPFYALRTREYSTFSCHNIHRRAHRQTKLCFYEYIEMTHAILYFRSPFSSLLISTDKY